MEKFDIHILGCGSALPTTRHQATSQVLNIREKLFMIDCGEGAQVQLRRAKLKFSRLNHIFISHLHGDHCFGLMGLISTFGMLERTADLHIHAHADLQRLLEPQLEFFCKGMPYQVVFHPFNPGERTVIYDDRSVSVETIPLRHRLPTCGFLFREKPTPNHIRRDMIDFYGIPICMMNRIRVIPNSELTTPSDPPRAYAYCSDTVYLPRIAAQVAGVDLLFHEATFTESEAVRAKQTLHSTAAQAARIAKDAQVKRLLIGHFSARYEDEKALLEEAQDAQVKRLLIGHFSARYEDEKALLEEAQAIFPDTLAADEGLKISL